VTAWSDGFAGLETPGPPGAEDHRLAWRAGELHLVAHPDPDADRTMHALGAETCPCLALLDAWEAAHEDGGFLVVAPRDPQVHLPVPTEAIRLLSADLARWQGAIGGLRDEAGTDRAAVDRLAAAAVPAEAAARRRLGALLLLALERPLQLRLQASVGAALAARSAGRVALEVATAARAIGPLREAGWHGGREDMRLTAGDGEEAEIAGSTATLPPLWISTVWARGLADAVPGYLVVDVTSVTPGGPVEVVAAAPGKGRVEMRVDRWENA
jgi:hypothetical protein